MARPRLPPSPSPFVAVKRDPDEAEPTPHTPVQHPRKKQRRGGRLPVTPTHLPLSPLLTPQAIPSGASGAESIYGLTPTSTITSIKRERDADAGADAGAGESAVGRRKSRNLCAYARPAAAEPPTSWLNRHRLVRILHELARAHRWRDAASVFSTLLRASHRPGSFEETHSIFVVAMEIHKRLAEDSGVQGGIRSRYFLRTQKLFDVWMRKLIWCPRSQKKHLVKLELALFYLSRGNIDIAYNATRSLIAKEGLQMEPVLNLIHGLISYDKWYSGLPKDIQIEEFDVYNESCSISTPSDGHQEIGSLDNSDTNNMHVHDANLSAFSSVCSINNENIDRKINNRPGFVNPKYEYGPSGSQVTEGTIYKDFQSIFVNNLGTPMCGLEKTLLPLRLKPATGTSNDCFNLYWKYKSTPSTIYEDAEKCLRLALHANPPVMAALLPLIQILLLGDKLKDALNELETICHSSTTALPFRLKGRLLEYFDQNQVLTISSCYEEALRRDPTCSYSMEALVKLHRKGYYNTIQLLEAIALHLDSLNGKLCIWEELVSCFLRLFSDQAADNEDCISCTDVQGHKTLSAFSKYSSVFFEQITRETWKVRCRWWMHHHFSQKAYMSATLTGDCRLLATKAACASHLFGPEFPYVKAAGSYLTKQKATDEFSFLAKNKRNSVRLLQTLEELTS